MISFLEFLEESKDHKNLHLEHLEDVVWTEGIHGVQKALNILTGLEQGLEGNSEVQTTIKWDGSPAIICGIHPETKKFFVGTKAVFSNKSPKICYTPEDIQEFYEDNLVLQDRLAQCLKYLPKLKIKGIVQGDLLYLRSDLRMTDIDGEKCVVFQPNTIFYAVPAASDMGKKITKSRLGIVFHTRYVGDTMENSKAQFGVSSSEFAQVPEVFLVSPDTKFGDSAALSEEESKQLESIKASIQNILTMIDPEEMDVIVGGEISKYAKIHYNQLVRSGSIPPADQMLDSFQDFVSERFNKIIGRVKLRQTKKKRMKEKTRILSVATNEDTTLKQIYTILELLTKAKNIFLGNMNAVTKGDLKTFLVGDEGLKKTPPEGYVVFDKSGAAIKMVNRLEFSKANFEKNK